MKRLSENNARTRARRWRSAIFLLFLPTVVLLAPAPRIATAGSQPGFTGKLAYAKTSFSYQLFALSQYQWDVTALSASSAPSRRPVASPDGSQIAFMSTRGDGRWNIYISAANGANVRQLTNAPGREAYAPRWSPDGQRIVFYSWGGSDNQIRTIRVDGSDEQVLTGGLSDGFPDYSPDGTRIVFGRITNGNPDIWVMNADGSNPIPIVNSSAREMYPVWSPDGNWIAFCRAGSNSALDIWIAHPDGSGATDVTPDAAIDADPSWTPDSQSLLYSSASPKYTWSLFSVPVIGGTPVALGSIEDSWRDFPSSDGSSRILYDGLSDSLRTDVCVRTPSRDRCFGRGSSPSLSPNGKSLLFIRDGRLRQVTISSGKVKVLVRAGMPVADPTWSPDGHSVAFIALKGTKLGLFTLDLRARGKRRLLASAAAIGWPSWGKNGLIAYTDFGRLKSSIWVVKAKGGGRRKSVSSSGNDYQAVWAPNGRSLAFLSDRSGLAELYVRAAAGGKARALTSDRQFKRCPFWAPGGSKIGYTQIDSIWGDQRFVVVPTSGGTTSLLLRAPQPVDEGSWRQ